MVSFEIIFALVTIILISASPIGEILVAIPAGIALGIDPILTFAVAYPANLLPTIFLLMAMEHFKKSFPRIFNYFTKKGSKLQKYIQGRYGSTCLLLITPLIGVYATSISSMLLGFGKKRSFILQAVSLLIYGVIEALGFYFGLRLLYGSV
ncbi:MAG: small multi-drug export protein [archaeon]|nr:small multi-drug export protein [archaeon]MCP8315551.1 small multi-drug export protein [archaeon]MCP8320308.1 small multi-drug export protein [archaeon]